jgi:hypothetical protein
VHYGYVGLAVGFERGLLLDGAGAAQLWHDLKQRPPWPERSGPWILPRNWDRPEDRIAIRLGFELFKSVPSQMIAEVLVRAIVKTKGLKVKPANVAPLSAPTAGSAL